MKDLISRYVWLVDTLSRYKTLTREQINELWLRSSLSDGRKIPPRTFYHYRRMIERNFNIDIKCNSAGEYYIEREEDPDNRRLTNWLLDSFAVNSAVRDAGEAAGRIAVEDVPSAREFLPTVIDALTDNRKIEFTYAGFNRARHEKGIIFHPYFVKRYKQRWYMIGFKEKGSGVRTYALDRVKELKMLPQQFTLPGNVSHADFFDNVIGATTSKAPVRIVKLQVEPTQAKYFRALPFHVSQQEELHDKYSIFTFRLKLNYELVHEILAFGNTVRVLAPRELEIMVTQQLRETLALYDE